MQIADAIKALSLKPGESCHIYVDIKAYRPEGFSQDTLEVTTTYIIHDSQGKYSGPTLDHAIAVYLGDINPEDPLQEVHDSLKEICPKPPVSVEF